jgi:hypothetical protein
MHMGMGCAFFSGAPDTRFVGKAVIEISGLPDIKRNPLPLFILFGEDTVACDLPKTGVDGMNPISVIPARFAPPANVRFAHYLPFF